MRMEMPKEVVHIFEMYKEHGATKEEWAVLRQFYADMCFHERFMVPPGTHTKVQRNN